MKNKQNAINIMLKTAAIFLVLISSAATKAQTLVTSPMTGTPAPGDYYNYTSITVSPSFSFTPTGSQHLYLYVLPAGCNPLGTTPTAAQNYIVTSTPRISGITTTAQLAGRSTCDLMQTVQYFDGLGRPLQTVQVKGNPDATKDVIQPFAYDAYGREILKYMPYTLTASTPGSYQSAALDGGTGYTSGGQYAFYQVTGQGYVNTTKPLAGIGFEPSPLNRPVEQAAPGTDWQLGGGHTIRMEYGVNNQNAFATTPIINNPGSRKVALYTATINSNFTRTLTRTGNTATYNNSTLSLTITKDENWKSGADSCLGTTEEYKDLAGRVVLKRTYNLKNSAIEILSTYYVYDNAGNLCFVLPPDANPDAAAAISQATLDNFAYQYRFDERNRPTQKKLPGKGWEYTVYNPLDKVVATQDSLQRVAGQWIFTKYDNFGRVVMTGIWAGTVGLSRASLQTTLNATTTYWETTTGTGTGYTTVAWPTSATTPLTINYYDKYTNIPSLPAAYSAPTGATTNTQGLLVGSKVAVLNTPANMLLSVHYFDQLGRNIKTYTQHYLGGTLSSSNYDAVASTYNFINILTSINRQHFNTTHATTPLVTINEIYMYDHMGRKLKTWEKIINGTTATAKTLISKADFNEVGQIKTKHLHSTDSVNFQQNIDFTYNERGWMLTNSSSLFAMQLYYNTGTNKAYNGNIMYQYWGTPGSLTKNYVYLYDRLNRLVSGASTDHNVERGITYDMQGNITTLNRVYNNIVIDSLTYSYTGNKLVSIIDKSSNNTGLVAATTNYNYDGNGNLSSNSNSTNSGQNKNYSYNLLNLPQTATIAAGTITYTYDGSGNKLRKQSPTLGNTDYINGIQYSSTITGLPDFIQTEEGRAVPSGTTAYKYYYYLTDNLDNTRITFDSSTGISTILQKDDYMPFGMEINWSVASPKNEYLYNKKELQEELGLYDYKVRYYDAVVGRFTSVDRLSDSYVYKSPYDYAENRPINGVDLDGLEWSAKAEGNGNTKVSVNVKFTFDVDPKLLPQGTTVENYKSAINNTFNQVFQNSTEGKFSGEVTFNGGDVDNSKQVIPLLSLYTAETPPGAKYVIGGITTDNASGVNIMDRNGNLRTPEQVALDASHELFHTVRVAHPIEQSQGPDTKLTHNSGNDYSTTPTTDPKISYNIMMYPMIKVNGTKLGDLWKDKKPLNLTKDQIKLILDEIKKQQNGQGSTTDRNRRNYWDNYPEE